MIMRAICGNWMICMANFFAIMNKSFPGKVLGIGLGIMTFGAIGYDHAVANWNILTFGKLLHPERISWKGFILCVTLGTIGNMIGGFVFVSCPTALTIYLARTHYKDGIPQPRQKEDEKSIELDDIDATRRRTSAHSRRASRRPSRVCLTMPMFGKMGEREASAGMIGPPSMAGQREQSPSPVSGQSHPPQRCLAKSIEKLPNTRVTSPHYSLFPHIHCILFRGIGISATTFSMSREPAGYLDGFAGDFLNNFSGLTRILSRRHAGFEPIPIVFWGWPWRTDQETPDLGRRISRDILAQTKLAQYKYNVRI
jgi:hypothetical protein